MFHKSTHVEHWNGESEFNNSEQFWYILSKPMRVCPEEMVELRGLVELPVVEVTGAYCSVVDGGWKGLWSRCHQKQLMSKIIPAV